MIEFTDFEKNILLSVFPQGVIALDLETTGLSPMIDKIIELSAVKITKSGATTFDQLINPQRLIPQVTIDIHGITDEMIKNSPLIKNVLPKFLEFAEGLPIIAHNAKFDVGFLIFEMHHLGLAEAHSDIYCSWKFSRLALKDMENYKLGTLVKTLGIPLLNHHRALDDAIACLKVFIKSLEKFSDKNRSYKLREGLLFNMADFSKNTEFEIPKKLKGLETKLATREVIEIKYKGGTLKNIFRPIRPISFLPLPTGNVLYAHCLNSNMHKSFSLKKISEYRDVEKAQRVKFISLAAKMPRK